MTETWFKSFFRSALYARPADANDVSTKSRWSRRPWASSRTAMVSDVFVKLIPRCEMAIASRTSAYVRSWLSNFHRAGWRIADDLRFWTFSDESGIIWCCASLSFLPSTVIHNLGLLLLGGKPRIVRRVFSRSFVRSIRSEFSHQSGS